MEIPETRYARGAEGYVGYQILGDGPIDLLFVSSWRWNIEVMWDEPRVERFFQRLASFARVIVFDKRGTGISDPVPLGALPTLEQWTDDIATVLDTVESKNAALLAHGDGSMMAMVYAAMHPDRTSALVVMDGWARSLEADDYRPGLSMHQLDRMIEVWTQSNIASHPGTRLNIVAPSLAGDETFRSRWNRFVRLSLPPSAYEGTFRWVMQLDVRPVLPTIRVPTLVLHRTGDRLARIQAGRYIAEHIPDAKFVEVPGDDWYFFVGDQGPLLDEIQGFLTGVRASPDVDRVLATILFTDIVSSTEHAAALGDKGWREILDAHETVSRREVERFQGKLVNTTGDGILATFDGPARTIRCARAIGAALRDRGIEIRAGLHTGEVERRGSDIGGIAVHLAARVMAEADPGEVVVSSTVKDLVIGSGIEFEDRGAHALKGVPGEWRLFAVRS